MTRYLVRDDDGALNAAISIDAPNARRAAERYCEIRDQANVEFPPESTVVVQSETGVSITFVVVLESVPIYHARRAKGE